MRTRPPRVYIGTAGWSIPRASALDAPVDGTHLQRYAQMMAGAEINSSFYRAHAATTYARWAASTPAAFRFAVKVPRQLTHEQQLRRSRPGFAAFLNETAGLGERRGPLLVQLPPSFAFDLRVATRFLDMVRSLYDGPLVWEPRHATWFCTRAEALLMQHRVARVAADPVVAGGVRAPGGWQGMAYFRLHGAPQMYWSRYDVPALAALAEQVRRIAEGSDGEVWCIFDNTAGGAALDNACELQHRLG